MGDSQKRKHKNVSKSKKKHKYKYALILMDIFWIKFCQLIFHQKFTFLEVKIDINRLP